MSQPIQDSQEYDSLVYPPTSIPQTSHINTPMAEPWNHTHHSPPNSSSSSGPSSHIYSVVNRSANHIDFPSPSASISFPHTQNDLYIGHHNSPSISNGQDNQAMSLNLNQVESSVGPCRFTRSRRRGLRGVELSSMTNGSQDINEHHIEPYYMEPTVSRPQTPSNMLDQARYHHHRNSISLGLGRSALPLQSPRYASTPPSISPGYSSYGFHHTGSRSASHSISNPRSASPALSVASSALTSISSSASAANARPYAYNPYPVAYQNGSMSPAPGRKHKKRRLTNSDRKEICVFAMENPNARQEDIAVKFGVERSTVSKILKNKHKFLNIPDGEELRVSKHRPSKFPEMEAQLETWLREMKDSGPSVLLSDAVIKQKARDVARGLGIDNVKFKASQGWIENFKARQGIRGGVWSGEGKKLQIARATGAGALPPDVSHDAALSPLNPAFDARPKTMDEESSMPPQHLEDDMDGGLESEDDGDLPDDELDPHGTDRAQTSTGLGILQPAWQPHLEPSTSSTQSSSSGPGVESISQTSYVHQQHHTDIASMHLQHMPIPSHQQTKQTSAIHSEVHHEGGYATATYDAPAIYAPAPQLTSSGVPSMPEVEDSINKVIAFVEAQGENFISWGDREALTQIKNAIFQAASGVPYDREGRS